MQELTIGERIDTVGLPECPLGPTSDISFRYVDFAAFDGRSDFLDIGAYIGSLLESVGIAQ